VIKGDKALAEYYVITSQSNLAVESEITEVSCRCFR